MLVSKTSIKGERDWCFAVDKNNHISALLCKTRKEKQENMKYVLLNRFMIATDSEHSETFEALIPLLWGVIRFS